MPQMFPLNWIMISFFLFMILIVTLTKMFFLFNNFYDLNSTHKKHYNQKFSIKW